MEEMHETPQKTLDKKPEDLTTGEIIKLNVATVAVFAAIPAAFYAGATAYDKARTKVRNFREKRALAKVQEITEEEES